MKKLLLASVATLAVAAFAAGAQAAESKDGLKLGLGGYFSVQGANISQDNDANLRKSDIFQYGELNATAEKTFDNGLTVGYKAVLTNSGATDASATGNPNGSTFRQNFAYFSGNWGRVEAGQNYSPVYYMNVGAPSVNDEFDSFDPDFSLVTNAGSAVVSASGAMGGTYAASTGNYATVGSTTFYKTGGLLGDKIVYYTPRFNGFQAGVSYQPDAERSGDGTKSVTTGLTANNTPGQQSERTEVAAGYEGAFSGVGVKVGGGYSEAKLEAALSNNKQGKDQKAWNAGAQVSYQNWTLGGGYLWDNNGQKFSATNALNAGNSADGVASGLRGATVTADGETSTYTAGLSYGTGPYSVGVSYFNSSTDVVRLVGGANNSAVTALYRKSDDRLERWVVGANYKVAPGVSLGTTAQFHKYDVDNKYGVVQGATAAVANTTGNNEATVITLGSTINF